MLVEVLIYSSFCVFSASSSLIFDLNRVSLFLAFANDSYSMDIFLWFSLSENLKVTRLDLSSS